MPYLQIVNGKYRRRLVAPPELRPYLTPPHTGKANLTRALGTGNEREANRLAANGSQISRLRSPAPLRSQKIPMDMIRLRAIAPTTAARTDLHLRRVFSHHTRRWHFRRRKPNRSPLIGSSCFGRNRRTRPKRATRTWRQNVAGSPNGSVTMTWRASGLRTAGITATR
jgi:hypothetical protein